MNQYFGWIQGSDMPSTYVHMSGKEVDKAILSMNGIATEEMKEQSKLQPVICSRCDTINSADVQRCNKCAGLLDLKYAMQLEDENKGQDKINDIMRSLLEDKAMMKELSKRLHELGS